MEIEEEVYNKIVSLCEQGDALVNKGEPTKAIKEYETALELVPNPKEDFEASSWIYTAIGDTYFLIENYDEAIEYLFKALNCIAGIGNPFILLRIGQCFFELKNLRKAQEFLIQSYMLEGEEIFEEENYKYFELIKPIV